MRFCEVPNCQHPVFGTDKNTRIGYCKFHQNLRTDISKESIIQRAITKQRKNAIPKAMSSLRQDAYNSDFVREKQKTFKSKSQLLKEADTLFADYIKRRDTGKDGRIYCPCCKKYFTVGDSEVNCMHFIDRDIYLLRFDEDAAHAGHAHCNRNQHYNPKGKEYQNFREYMVEKFGEIAVVEMELAHRKINKLVVTQLKNVIEHYS